MSKPNLSPFALAAVLLLVACSDAPAPETNPSPDTPTRQIELAVPAPIDSGVASDLEVGRSTMVPVRRVAALRAVESPKAAPAPLGELAAPVTRISLPAVVSAEVLQPVAVPTAPAVMSLWNTLTTAWKSEPEVSNVAPVTFALGTIRNTASAVVTDAPHTVPVPAMP